MENYETHKLFQKKKQEMENFSSEMVSVKIQGAIMMITYQINS